MKVVILAGGLGTRISEESQFKPKPMIEIGGMPILIHIMKIYASHGFNDFIILLGYKGYLIKEYFKNYFLHNSDFEVNLKDNKIEMLNSLSVDWKVKLIDTGFDTNTGGRIKRIRKFLNKNENFFLTYGDGVSDVNLKEELSFHLKHKKLATICAVKPAGRYGVLEINNSSVTGFVEKPKGDDVWINGGFFVLNEKVIDYIENDQSSFEDTVLEKIIKIDQLNAYTHKGFWQAMDTLRDRRNLEEKWSSGLAEWKKW